MMSARDRIKTLLKLEAYRASTKSPVPLSQESYVDGYDASSGRITLRTSNGSSVDAQTTQISGLGLSDRGLGEDGWFV